MGRRSTDKAPDLFLLIKSMTGAEKRYFTIFSSQHVISGQNNYIRLFKAIDKQKLPDEKELLRLFSGEKFAKQLHRVKNYLYHLIIDSLTRYYSESNIKGRVTRILEKAEVLYAKGLYSQCSGIVMKAKKIALQYELYPRMIDILEFERRIMNHETYFKFSEKDIQTVFREKEGYLNIINNINDYQTLTRQLQFFAGKPLEVIQNNIRSKIIPLFMALQSLQKKAPPLSNDARREYYLGCIFYYLLTGDTKMHYEYTHRYLSLIETNEYYITENPNIYITALCNFLMASLNRNKWDDRFQSALSKLDALYHHTPYKEYATEDIRALLFVRLHINKLLFHEKSGHYEKTLKMIPEIEEGMEKHKTRISPRLNAILHFNLGCNYIGLEEYRKANHHFGEILNAPNKEMEDIFYYSKVLSILCHYELRNFELLEYSIKSARRQLSENAGSFKVEICFLDLMRKKLLKAGSKRELAQSYIFMREKLSAILEQSGKNGKAEYFNFIYWTESKIRNRPFREIVREQAGVAA